jgi:hypothetical protein
MPVQDANKLARPFLTTRCEKQAEKMSSLKKVSRGFNEDELHGGGVCPV